MMVRASKPWFPPGVRWIPLGLAASLAALGCSGTVNPGPRGGELPAPRRGNVEVVLLSFGSVQGELLECG